LPDSLQIHPRAIFFLTPCLCVTHPVTLPVSTSLKTIFLHPPSGLPKSTLVHSFLYRKITSTNRVEFSNIYGIPTVRIYGGAASQVCHVPRTWGSAQLYCCRFIRKIHPPFEIQPPSTCDLTLLTLLVLLLSVRSTPPRVTPCSQTLHRGRSGDPVPPPTQVLFSDQTDSP
jgi:hypothetical protein